MPFLMPKFDYIIDVNELNWINDLHPSQDYLTYNEVFTSRNGGGNWSTQRKPLTFSKQTDTQ